MVDHVELNVEWKFCYVVVWIITYSPGVLIHLEPDINYSFYVLVFSYIMRVHSTASNWTLMVRIFNENIIVYYGRIENRFVRS